MACRMMSNRWRQSSSDEASGRIETVKIGERLLDLGGGVHRHFIVVVLETVVEIQKRVDVVLVSVVVVEVVKVLAEEAYELLLNALRDRLVLPGGTTVVK